MTQAVADKRVNLSHVAQVSDLLQRVLKGSLSEEQMQAIALVVGSGQDPTTTALARMIKIAYKRNPTAIKQLLGNLLALYSKSETTPQRQPDAHLRHRLSLTLPPTKGTVTIASATDVFSYIDPNFQNWGTNVAGADTLEVLVKVLEMTRNGNYQELFGSLPRALGSLYLSQGQIVEFCLTLRQHLLQEGYGTMFLFAIGSELFVADVDVLDLKLRVFVTRFEDDRVWDANYRPRFVVLEPAV